MSAKSARLVSTRIGITRELKLVVCAKEIRLLLQKEQSTAHPVSKEHSVMTEGSAECVLLVTIKLIMLRTQTVRSALLGATRSMKEKAHALVAKQGNIKMKRLRSIACRESYAASSIL